MHLSRLLSQSYLKELLASGALVASAIFGPSHDAKADHISSRNIEPIHVKPFVGPSGEQLYQYEGSMPTSRSPEERAEYKWMEDCSAAPAAWEKAFKSFRYITANNQQLPQTSHIPTASDLGPVMLALIESPDVTNTTELLQTAVDYKEASKSLGDNTQTSFILSGCMEDLCIIYGKKAEVLNWHRQSNPPSGTPEEEAQSRAWNAIGRWNAGWSLATGAEIPRARPYSSGFPPELDAAQNLIEELREFRISSAAIELIDSIASANKQVLSTSDRIPDIKTIEDIVERFPVNTFGDKNSPAETVLLLANQIGREQAQDKGRESSNIAKTRVIQVQALRNYMIGQLKQNRTMLEKCYNSGEQAYYDDYLRMRKQADLQIGPIPKGTLETLAPQANQADDSMSGL